MLKLGIQLKEEDNNLNIELLDPTKKQLDSASENEKITAQIIKDVLKDNIIDLIVKHEDIKKED